MPREYLEFQLGSGASADFQEHSLLNRDGSDHKRLRVLMGKAFSAPVVRRMRDHIADILEPLLEPLLSGEPFDVVPGIAHPLPAQVICELPGIDGVDREEVRHKVADLASRDRASADAAIEWSRDFLIASVPCSPGSRATSCSGRSANASVGSSGRARPSGVARAVSARI